jgi:chromosome segregation ATPase
MFKAIGRFFTTIGYLLTGRLDAKTKGINEDPSVVRARYDELISQKRQSILQVRNAVAGVIRNAERKRSELQSTKENIAQKERLMSGAKAMATKLAKGRNREEAQQDMEFVKCMKAFQDFKSSLEILEQRRESLELDIQQTEKDAKGYEVQLQGVHRELQSLVDERERSVADVAMARETRAASEVLAGVANDGTADDLRRLRETVAQAKAEAQVTSRMAGTDTVRQEAEFLELAGGVEAESEFLDGIFGTEKDDTVAPDSAKAAPEGVTKEKQRLPE